MAQINRLDSPCPDTLQGPQLPSNVEAGPGHDQLKPLGHENGRQNNAYVELVIQPPDASGSFSQDYPTSPDQEQQDIEYAIQRSLIAQSKQNRRTSRTSTSIYQENIDDIILGLGNDFAPIAFPEGDTVVFIGAPPKTRGEDGTDYAYVSRHFEQLHRLRSDSIKSLNSAKFNELLGPKSIRTERRLRKAGLLGHFDLKSIKLYVDLRPPSEDEEAIILLTDLTCTRGVLSWHHAQSVFNIPRTWICGKDNFRKISDIYTNNRRLSDLIFDDLAEPQERDRLVRPIGRDEDNRLEPEYSPLRHRSAIERLLQAIEYGDPKLDSAPKLWSYFAIAKYFDCATHERVNGWITKWVFVGQNINFIQCNPEVTLRLGMGIRSLPMTRNAFSILVGEKALLNVYGEADPSVFTPLIRSIHGRTLELLDEDERNRIDHAAASLVRSVRAIFSELVDGQMTWMTKSTNYSGLVGMTARDLEEEIVIQTTIQMVKDFVRGRIFWVLCRDYLPHLAELRQTVEAVSTFYSGLPPNLDVRYNQLNQPMRLFTRTFWIALSQEKLYLGNSNTCNDGAVTKDVGSGWNRLATAMQSEYATDPEGGIKTITRHELYEKICIINEILARHKEQDERALEHAARQLPEYSSILSMPNNPAKSNARHSRGGSIENIQFESLSVSSPKRAKEDDTRFPSSAEKRRRTDAVKPSVPFQRPENFDLPIRVGRADGRMGTGFVDARESHENSQIAKTQALMSVPQKNVTNQFSASTQALMLNQNPHQASPGDVTSDHGHPFASPIAVSPNPARYGGQQGQGSKQDTVVRTQPGPSIPNKMGDETYDGCKAPGSTKYDFVKEAESGHPVKNFPPHAPGNASAVQTSNDENDELQFTLDLPEQPRRNKIGAAHDSWQTSSPQKVEGAQTKTAEERASITAVQDMLLLRQTHNTPTPLRHHFSIAVMLEQLTYILQSKCQMIVDPPHLFQGPELVPTDLIDTLMCLDEDEWKYLPLWAGGNDDGTGGVFDEVDVPNLEKGGFRGGRRGIDNVDGTPAPSVSDSVSSYDDMASDAISTVGRASKHATDGTQTIRSFSDTTSEGDAGFMRQDELWDEIRDMKVQQAGHVSGKARAVDLVGTDGPANAYDSDMNMGDAEVSTVMGGLSDVQGDMFGDIDDDKDDDDDEVKRKHNEDEAGRTAESDESDLEIIDRDEM